MVRWGSERLGGGFHQPLGTEDHSFRIFGDSQLGGSFHAGGGFYGGDGFGGITGGRGLD